MALTVGSLFAGIGGFDLGFERAGFEIRWQVEIDPFCRRVLEKHWPAVRRYEDVRTVGPELERVDVLCGGFPCQDISVAGKGAGIDGARSGLWSEYARLIGELRPRYVVVENVAALLTRGLGRVLGDLAARGYDAEWDCIPASAIGAPHRRDRVWLVAYTGSEQHQGACYADRRASAARLSQRVSDANGRRQQERTQFDGAQTSDSADRDSRRQYADGLRNDVADADGSGLSLARHSGAVGSGPARIFAGATIDRASWWAIEPNVGRVAHGVPARVDRLRGLGNAIVPQIAEWIARRILEAEQELGNG